MHEVMLIFTAEGEESEVECLNTIGDQEATSRIYPVEQTKHGEHWLHNLDPAKERQNGALCIWLSHFDLPKVNHKYCTLIGWFQSCWFLLKSSPPIGQSQSTLVNLLQATFMLAIWNTFSILYHIYKKTAWNMSILCRFTSTIRARFILFPIKWMQCVTDFRSNVRFLKQNTMSLR